MEPDIVLEIIAAVTGVLTILAALYGAYWLHLRQKPVSEAETAAKYQQIADMAANRALRLEERINKLEESNRELEEKYQEVKKELDIYKRWTERLVHQIKSLGHEPIEKP